MKSFTWRILLHTVPTAIAVLIVAWAAYSFSQGEGGFKLGVDLAGGTILVYEVDPNRRPEHYKPEELAASLKRRIDPADLYNVTIRPLSQDRIEIILPTGGHFQQKRASDAWKGLIQQARQWVQDQYKQKTGKDLDLTVPKDLPVQVGDAPVRVAEAVGLGATPGVGDAAAQLATLTKAQAEYTQAARPLFEDPDNTPTGQAGQLVNNLYALAQYAADRARQAEGPETATPGATAELPFSKDDLQNYVNSLLEPNRKKFLTGEDVKEIKQLIAQVGALEFRILANDRRDKPAIDAARAFFEDNTPGSPKRAELDKRAEQGLPPPSPGTFLTTSPTDPGPFRYEWVELGPAERQQLGLENAVEKAVQQEPALEKKVQDKEPLTAEEERLLALAKQQGPSWREAQEHREKGTAYLRVLTSRDSYSNMLLYSRKAQNRNVLKEEDLPESKKYEYFVLTRMPPEGKEITGQYLVGASEGHDSRSQLAVNFRFNATGAALFRELTSANRPEGTGQAKFDTHLAIILDGLVMSAPAIRTTISGEGQITGNFDPAQVERLVNILRAGQLPATLRPNPVSENTISPTLGAETVKWGAISVVLAFAAVLVFMIIYYRFAGMVACIALLANLVLTIAFMVLVKATFTLPGLAGLVLMLGMAVDANVLIYERLREERDRGASLALAIRNGYDRAFPAIIDTHLTSIFTAIVLYIVGNDQLKGFGISLTSGLIISLWTSLFMTRTIFDLGLARGWIKELKMMRFLSKPNINFMAIRNYMFATTVFLSLAGAAVFAYRVGHGGLNIDFVGGTAYRGQLAQPETIEDLRVLLGPQAQKQGLNVAKIEPATGEPQTEFRVTFAAGQIKGPGGQEVTYPEYTRTLVLAKPETPENVRRRLGEALKDASVEQIYDADSPGGAAGSTKFNVRTTERESAIVLAAIDRLMGDHLKQTDLEFQVAPDGRSAELLFFGPKAPGGEGERPRAFASPATVKQLLTAALKEKGFADEARQVRVDPFLDRETESRLDRRAYKMTVTVPPNEALKAKLAEVLTIVKTSLAHQPEPEAIENFDSALAQDMQQKALYAILASWAAILLYLWFRFGNWTFGLAAVLCLIHDLLFTLGAIGIAHYVYNIWPGFLLIQDFKIDLPAVAALLTLVGFSVNDTIVVFDRIREVRGKSPELTFKMINDSVNQTLSRTILTSFITWLVVFVLYVAGGEGVHLFAFVMVIGVIIGTYSSIYVAAPLLIMLGEGRRRGQPREQPQAATAE